MVQGVVMECYLTDLYYISGSTVSTIKLGELIYRESFAIRYIV